MALSRCPNAQCGSVGAFQLFEANIASAAYKQYFVQCSRCGTVVAVVPFYDPGVAAHENSELLGKLQQNIATLQDSVVHVSAQVADIQRRLS